MGSAGVRQGFCRGTLSGAKRDRLPAKVLDLGFRGYRVLSPRLRETWLGQFYGEDPKS